MSNMIPGQSQISLTAKKRLDQRGALSLLVVPLILAVMLFFAAAGFGFLAYGSRQDYKDNVDQKVAAAVTTAKQQTQTADAAQYAEQAKLPFDTYIGPSAFGNLTVKYPKTWSAYVAEDNNGW